MAIAAIDDSKKTAEFPEYFEVNPSPAPGSSELQVFIAELKDFIDFLGMLEVAKIPQMTAADAAIVEAKRPLRTQIMNNLLDISREVRDQSAKPEDGTRLIIIERGRYDAGKNIIEQSLFVVSEKFETVPGQPANEDKAVDLLVSARSGTASKVVPPEKEKLYVALTNAMTVLKTSCDRIRNKREQHPDNRRADALLDEFVRKLAGIGRVGLQGDHTSLATAALDSTKAEFFAREASKLKTLATRALGWWAFSAATAFFMIYFLCRWCVDLKIYKMLPVAESDVSGSFFVYRKEFFLLLAGAALGTWMSFALRSLDVTFEDLGKLKDEFLGPSVRIAFVVGIATALGLVFWTKAFAIKIGDLNVEPPIRGAAALLVGIFGGLSERALATAISSRAATFIKGVAG